MSITNYALQNKKVLVTGATGFIGGRLAARLATEEGAIVTGSGRNLQKATALQEQGVQLRQADLLDEGRMGELVQGQDVVFHVAAWLGGGRVQDQEAEAHAMNVTASELMVRLTAAAGVARLVLVSSIASYGLPQRRQVDEDHPLDTSMANDLYGRTKALGEIRATALAQELGVNMVVVRPALVYGPRSQGWSVQMLQLVQKGTPVLFGGGHGHAWPVYIDNLVDGMLLAATHSQAVGEAFNFTDSVTDWRTFFDYYGQMCGRKPRQIPLWGARLLAWANGVFNLGLPLNPQRVRFLTSKAAYPTSKAVQLLGYKTRVDLAEGMRRTEAWLREAGYL